MDKAEYVFNKYAAVGELSTRKIRKRQWLGAAGNIGGWSVGGGVGAALGTLAASGVKRFGVGGMIAGRAIGALTGAVTGAKAGGRLLGGKKTYRDIHGNPGIPKTPNI